MTRHIERGGTADDVAWAAKRQVEHGDVRWSVHGQLWEAWTHCPPSLNSKAKEYRFRVNIEPRYLHELADEGLKKFVSYTGLVIHRDESGSWRNPNGDEARLTSHNLGPNWYPADESDTVQE